MKTKLLTVKEGLIIIDEEAEIKKSELCYDEEKEQEFTSNEHTQLYKTESNLKVFKIIASSFIDELPKISQSVEEIRQMIKDKEIEEYVINFLKKQHPNFEWNNISRAIKEDMVDLLKSDKNEYTREQMIEAVKLAKWGMGNKYELDDILKSLEPKVDCYVEVNPIDISSITTRPAIVSYSITKIL